MATLYCYIPQLPQAGSYTIEANADESAFRYRWSELVDDESFVEHGAWFPTRAAALRDAAANWDDAGSGGRLAATLRAAATRAEKKETATA